MEGCQDFINYYKAANPFIHGSYGLFFTIFAVKGIISPCGEMF